jgi:hypothetical protein
VEEVPKVHSRLPLGFVAGQFPHVQQGTSRVARQSFQMGIPAHLRGCRTMHQHSRNVEARLAPVHRWSYRRDPDRLPDTRLGDRRRSDLGLVKRSCFRHQGNSYQQSANPSFIRDIGVLLRPPSTRASFQWHRFTRQLPQASFRCLNNAQTTRREPRPAALGRRR